MSNPAQAIRRAVVEGLKLEATRAGDRVFGNRTRPVWKDDMPVLLVFTRDERAEAFQVAPRWYRRYLTVSIVVVDLDQGQPDDLVDDRLDELADKVERFFFRDPRLTLFGNPLGLGNKLEGPEDSPTGGFELEDSRLDSVELVTFQPDERPPERPLAAQRISFQVAYLQPAPEGRPEDLEPANGLDITYTLKPGDDLVDARDRVDLAGS